MLEVFGIVGCYLLAVTIITLIIWGVFLYDRMAVEEEQKLIVTPSLPENEGLSKRELRKITNRLLDKETKKCFHL